MIRLLLILIASVLVSFSSFAQKTDETRESKHLGTFPHKQVRYNSEMDKYDVTYYKLDLHANNSSAYISGKTTIKAKALEEIGSQVVFQLIDQLDVISVKVNSQAAEFEHGSDEVRIILTNSLANNDFFTVEIEYEGFSTDNSRGLTNSIHSQWDVPVTWTLSESFHSKTWFPVKESLTDKADSVDVYLTVPETLTGVSNGILKQVVDLGDGYKRFEWQSRYPIAYYLIFIAVANYQEYKIFCSPAGTDEPLLIQNYIYNVPGCLDYWKEGIDRTGGFIELFSELYGLYPFVNEKYGHVMAPFGGGMEHQTMSMMGGFSYMLVSHELAHMWFGDYVTCATWQDIWINEGFASYSEFLAREYQGLTDEAIIWMEDAHERAKQEPSGSVYIPAQEATNESRIFSYNLSYKKGAAIVHMLRYEINNDELFFSILKEFLNRHKFSHATGMDFLEVVNELTGDNYQWFFDQWYFGMGFPRLYVNYGRVEGDNFITISQQSSSGNDDIFRTSLEFQMFEGDEVVRRRFHVTESPQTFVFESEYPISSLVVDPDSWVLKSVVDISSTPTNPGESFTVGPNPFYDFLSISVYTINPKTAVTISDAMGRKVYSNTFNIRNYQIPTSKFQSGIYIMNVELENGVVETVKLVKN